MPIYKYSCLLRASKGRNGEKSLFEMFKKYPKAYDGAMFFVGGAHSVRSLDAHKKQADGMVDLLSRLDKADIVAGLDVHPTIGFFPPVLDEEANKYAKTCEITGWYNDGKLCSGNPENHEYVREMYRNYASMSKNFLYVDDDVLVGNCYCPDCIKRFEELYHVFGSLEPTRENLIKLFANKDMNERKRVRTAWIDFIALRSAEILSSVEKGVSDVDPDREIGIMSCTCGFDGMDCERWANSLRGNTKRKLRWRPGGGVYTEFTPNKALEKAHRLGAQIRYIPEFVDVVEAELENFTGEILCKSPNFTAFEILMYLAVGCTGVTFSGTLPDCDLIEEHEAFFDIAQKLRVTGNLLIDVFQREKPQGVGIWWDKYSAINLKEDNWDSMKYLSVPFANDVYQVGIPIAYDSENYKVTFLDENAALQISDEQAMEILKKGVLLDEKALDILNQRGFGEYTGFKTVKKLDRGLFELDTACSINMPGEHLRPINVGFCNEEVTNKSIIHILEKTNPNATELSMVVDFNQITHGIGSGIFENALGGRVAVDSVNTFNMHYTLPRNVRFKNLMRWLSKDTISYLKSYHRMAMWVRGNAAYLANMAMVEADNPQIFMATKSETAKVWVIKGGEVINHCIVKATNKEVGGCTFTLPQIPITGSVLIQCQ